MCGLELELDAYRLSNPIPLGNRTEQNRVSLLTNLMITSTLTHVSCLIACLFVFFCQIRLMHIGQFFNGVGGPVAMAAPPAISATWFPASQRSTATGLMYSLLMLGIALSFIIGNRILF